MYQLQKDTHLGKSNIVKRLSDNLFIPFDNGNSDYQDYLKWLDGYEFIGREWVQAKLEGNTPLPADQG
jgi:hypothetical protein